MQPYHLSFDQKEKNTESSLWLFFKYARVLAYDAVGMEVETVTHGLDSTMIKDLMEKDADHYVRSYYMFNQKRGRNIVNREKCTSPISPINNDYAPVLFNRNDKDVIILYGCSLEGKKVLIIENVNSQDKEQHIINIPVKNISYDPKSGAIVIVRDDSALGRELAFKEIFLLYEQDVNKYAFNGYIPLYPIPVGPGDMPEIVSAYVETVDTKMKDPIKGRRVRFVLKDAGMIIDQTDNAIPYEDALFFARVSEFMLATLLAAKKIEEKKVSKTLKKYQDTSQLIFLKLWQAMIDLGVFETIEKTKGQGKDEAYYREHPQEFIHLIPRINTKFFTEVNVPEERSRFYSKSVVNVTDQEENEKKIY